MSHDPTPQEPPVPALWDDEIERLIRRNESLDTMCHDLRAEVSRLEAENHRLTVWYLNFHQQMCDAQAAAGKLEAELAERGQWQPVDIDHRPSVITRAQFRGVMAQEFIICQRRASSSAGVGAEGEGA